MSESVGPLNLFQSLTDWLLQPHPRLKEATSIHQSRLLSAILLAVLALGAAIIAAVIAADPADINDPAVQGAFALSGIALAMYVLSRLGYHRIAALGLIFPFIAIFTYIGFFSGEAPI